MHIIYVDVLAQVSYCQIASSVVIRPSVTFRILNFVVQSKFLVVDFCVVMLHFGFFCGCRGFCQRTESDPFLFSSFLEPLEGFDKAW